MAGDEPSEGAERDANEETASDEPESSADRDDSPNGDAAGDASASDDPADQGDVAVEGMEQGEPEGGGRPADESGNDFDDADEDDAGDDESSAGNDEAASGPDERDADDDSGGDAEEVVDEGDDEPREEDDGDGGSEEGEDDDSGETEGDEDDDSGETEGDEDDDSGGAGEEDETGGDDGGGADSIDDSTDADSIGDDEDDGTVDADVDVIDDDPDADESSTIGGLFGGGRSGGPAEDREMPLADHIREMLRRLSVVIAVAGLVSLLVFPFAEEIINFLWYSILPGVETDIARPRLYGVLELLFTQLKVASLAGLIVALPVMVYETYAFMRPGLYPHERRYYMAAVPTSLVLALVGVSFAYFVILPAIFVYFLYYSQDVATIGFALGRTFDLILLLMGYMAIVFQIPLFIMLAMMMGLVTRRWLAARRLLFWGAFLGISFIFSPDPTGMAPIIVAATMIVLFEGTLLLTKWTGRE